MSTIKELEDIIEMESFVTELRQKKINDYIKTRDSFNKSDTRNIEVYDGFIKNATLELNTGKKEADDAKKKLANLKKNNNPSKLAELKKRIRI